MANNNDVVFVELDRKRELRFRHKAMKRLLAMNGKSVEEMEQGEDEFNLQELETIFFYGLEMDAREHGETLTMEMMEDILDYAPSYGYLLDKMREAFNKAMGHNEGNAQTAVSTNRASRRAK